MDDTIASHAPLPFIACAVVLLIVIASIDAHHGGRSAAGAIQEVLLLAVLHFALAACILLAAIATGHAA